MTTCTQTYTLVNRLEEEEEEEDGDFMDDDE